jgi:hypothetical protein
MSVEIEFKEHCTGPVTDFCNTVMNLRGFLKCWEFTDNMSNYLIVRKDYDPFNEFILFRCETILLVGRGILCNFVAQFV